jgi:uncharacterized protein (TIRG00374 family)
MSKKTILSIIRIIFLVCPILWLIFAVDYKSAFSVLKSVSSAQVFFLTAITFLRFVLQSIRFGLLTTPFDKINLLELISLDWKARYYSIIMPSSAGQDIMRAVLLKKYLSAGEIAAVSVFFRLTGIITLSLLSIFGFFRLYSQETVSTAIIFVIVLLLGICVFTAISFSEKAIERVLLLLPKKTPEKFVNFLVTSSKSIQLYIKHPKLIIFNFLLSLFLHLLFIVFPIAAIYAICGELKIAECLLFIPLIEIVAAAIPFSPNGAGIREGLLILFFEYINCTKEQAFSYITISIILYLMLFVGFFAVIKDKLKKKK